MEKNQNKILFLLDHVHGLLPIFAPNPLYSSTDVSRNQGWPMTIDVSKSSICSSISHHSVFGIFLTKIKKSIDFFTFILQVYIRISWKSHGLFCLGWKNQEDAVLYNAYKKINLLTQFLNMLSLGFYKLLINSFNPPRNKVVEKIKIQLVRPINWIINWIYISKN